MTCIVGFMEKDKVYIGGDSAGVAGLDVTVRGDEKVFVNGEFIFGFTSSFRMGNILRYNFIPPMRKEGLTDLEFLHGDFIDGIMAILAKKKFAKVENNEAIGGAFLFGYRGKLYFIDSDFQLGTSLDNYDAIGCGGNYAKGALSALECAKGFTPKDKILIALQSAVKHSGGVRPPFHVVECGAEIEIEKDEEKTDKKKTKKEVKIYDQKRV